MSKGGKREGAGRKKGIPNKATGEARDIAMQWGPEAIKAAARLAGLVIDPDTEEAVGVAESEQARLVAINTILDRAYGKPTQYLEHSGDVGIFDAIEEARQIAISRSAECRPEALKPN